MGHLDIACTGCAARERLRPMSALHLQSILTYWIKQHQACGEVFIDDIAALDQRRERPDDT